MNGLTPICNYCGDFSEKVTGKEIYPHRKDLYCMTFYRCNCQPGGAYVGCHGTSEKPLGRLANKELRQAKSAAHRAFDPLWRHKLMKRQEAYKWLGKQMNKAGSDCHIGMFDVSECRKVVELSKAKLIELTNETTS